MDDQDSLDTLPSVGLAQANILAQKELIALLEKGAMSDRAMVAWAEERGYDRQTLYGWLDRIQADLLIGQTDPDLIRRTLRARLARIAHGAEATKDYKAAVSATQVEAEVSGITGNRNGPSVAIQINTNAPLGADQIKALSDDDIRARLATLEKRQAYARSRAAQPHTLSADDLL